MAACLTSDGQEVDGTSSSPTAGTYRQGTLHLEWFTAFALRSSAVFD